MINLNKIVPTKLYISPTKCKLQSVVSTNGFVKVHSESQCVNSLILLAVLQIMPYFGQIVVTSYKQLPKWMKIGL